MVAVDWDSAMPMRHVLKHVLSKFFNGIEQRMIPATEMVNATSEGNWLYSNGREKRLYIQSDPIREHDCIWCMACVSVCPPQAIKVDQSNLEYHEKASGTFNESLSKGSSPPRGH